MNKITQKKAHIRHMVRSYIQEECRGYAQAKKKVEILACLRLEINERTLRAIMSELKHAGEIASHSSKGYWFIVNMTDPVEIFWVKKSWEEMRAKSLSMLTDCNTILKNLEARHEGARGIQKEFANFS